MIRLFNVVEGDSDPDLTVSLTMPVGEYMDGDYRATIDVEKPDGTTNRVVTKFRVKIMQKVELIEE